MSYFLNRKTEEISEFDPAINRQLLNEDQIQLSATSLSEAKKQAEPYLFAKRTYAPAEQFQTPSGQTVTAAGVAVPSTITSDDLTPRAPFTPATVTIPPPPTLTYEETPKEKEAVGLEEEIKKLRGELVEQPAFEAQQREMAGVEAKKQVFESLSRKIRDIGREQEAVPITIERESVGRGRTEGGVLPLQIGLRRTLAYEGLTLASRLDAARGDLDIAERKVQQAVDAKFAPIEARLREQEANYNMILKSPTTTRQEKNRALELDRQNEKYKEEVKTFKETQKAILDTGNKAMENLSKRGDLTKEKSDEISFIASNATSLFDAYSRLSPYLKEDDKEVLKTATLVAEQKGTAEQIEKVRNARDGAEAARIATEMGFVIAKVEKPPSLGTDFEQYEFFAKQRGEKVTQEGFFRFRTQLKEAEREPKGVEKPPTQTERLVAGYATRLDAANQVIREVGEKFTGVISRLVGVVPQGLRTADRQRFEQAKRNFINAVLRRESGAAIAQSEFDNAALQYFPQPGDGQEVLEQKRLNREMVATAFRLEAGGAFEALAGQTIKGTSYQSSSSGKIYQLPY